MPPCGRLRYHKEVMYMNNLHYRLEQEKIAQRQERLHKIQPLGRISISDIMAEREYQRKLAISEIAKGTYSQQ